MRGDFRRSQVARLVTSIREVAKIRKRIFAPWQFWSKSRLCRLFDQWSFHIWENFLKGKFFRFPDQVAFLKFFKFLFFFEKICQNFQKWPFSAANTPRKSAIFGIFGVSFLAPQANFGLFLGFIFDTFFKSGQRATGSFFWKKRFLIFVEIFYF